MSNTNANGTIELVEGIEVSHAQAMAIRKLALRSTKKSAEELANDLFAQVVRGRFKAATESIAKDAAEAFDHAVAGGFQPPMERAEYIAKAKAEYGDILRDL